MTNSIFPDFNFPYNYLFHHFQFCRLLFPHLLSPLCFPESTISTQTLQALRKCVYICFKFIIGQKTIFLSCEYNKLTYSYENSQNSQGYIWNDDFVADFNIIFRHTWNQLTRCLDEKIKVGMFMVKVCQNFVRTNQFYL